VPPLARFARRGFLLAATERNRRHPAGYRVQDPQPRGLTVKARNCSAAFRAAPRPDRQEPGQS
jgi:hypothetical protein